MAHQAAADALGLRSPPGSAGSAARAASHWACKFAVFEVSAKVGRHFWRRPQLPYDTEDWEAAAGSLRVRRRRRRPRRAELVAALRTRGRRAAERAAAARRSSRSCSTACRRTRSPPRWARTATRSTRHSSTPGASCARRWRRAGISTRRAREAAVNEGAGALPRHRSPRPRLRGSACELLHVYAELILAGERPGAPPPGDHRAPARVRAVHPGSRRAAGSAAPGDVRTGSASATYGPYANPLPGGPMRSLPLSFRARGAVLAAIALAAAAVAPAAQAHAHGGALFVQTDDLAGNTVVAYDRGADGRPHAGRQLPRPAAAAACSTARSSTTSPRRARSPTTASTACSTRSTPAATR